MEFDLQPFVDQLTALWLWLHSSIANLLLPSRLTQVVILVLLFFVAVGLNRWLAPKLYEQMRRLEGWPKWRLRLLLVVHQRLQLIFFVVLSWCSAGLMAQYSMFGSRRYILVLIATIATALLLAGFASRLVRNRTLRRIVRWGLWIYITLHYLNLDKPTAEFLDSAAIQFGNFRLSALVVLKALIVLGLLFTIARLTSSQIAKRVTANQDISPSMRVLTVKFVQTGFYGAAFFLALKAVGFDLTGLAVLSGAIGVGLGFGLQKVVSNLVSGVIILLDKSIKPGDVISLGDTFGWINALGARFVSVITRDGREFLIPNEDLITGQVVNWSHSNDLVRLDIYFGTAYDNDPHIVRDLAINAASSVHRVLNSQPPVCHIVGFGDSTVDYILRFWIMDPTKGLTNIRGNVYLALWDSFKENNITFPFPQREVRLLKNQE
ncbi:MAG: mechanosensitive ion channel family protein [Marinosulfonomonas sp.]